MAQPAVISCRQLLFCCSFASSICFLHAGLIYRSPIKSRYEETHKQVSTTDVTCQIASNFNNDDGGIGI